MCGFRDSIEIYPRLIHLARFQGRDVLTHGQFVATLKHSITTDFQVHKPDMRKRLASRYVISAIWLTLVSCATPVLSPDVIRNSVADISLPTLLEDPETFKGKLFLLGGISIQTVLTDKGSLIEAVYLPVDSRGVPKLPQSPFFRFLALCPESFEVSDPAMFQPERRMTLAGVYRGNRTGVIEGAPYIYPLFIIEALLVWDKDGIIRSFLFDPEFSMGTPSPGAAYSAPLVDSVPLTPEGSFPFLEKPDWLEPS